MFDVRTMQEAVDLYVDEVRNNPESASVWNKRVECWYHKGELDNAIKDFDEPFRFETKRRQQSFTTLAAEPSTRSRTLLERLPFVTKRFGSIRRL